MVGVYNNSLGYNYRMSDIQCALAKSQLSKVEKFIAKRGKLSTAIQLKVKQIETYTNDTHLS